MEEQQIRDFVHCVSTNEGLRNELTNDPNGVILRENFSPRVAQILARLVPHLTLDTLSNDASGSGWWWYC